jgi:hypothetical protein
VARTRDAEGPSPRLIEAFARGEVTAGGLAEAGWYVASAAIRRLPASAPLWSQNERREDVGAAVRPLPLSTR